MENITDERELLVNELTGQIKDNYKYDKPIRGHIKDYKYFIDDKYLFSIEFASEKNMSIVAMNNEAITSEVYPLIEKYHLTYHTSTGIDIPVNLERKICVIDNEEIEEFYNIGDINMYNTRIKEEYKNIIVKDFTAYNPEYSHNSFDKDKFYKYNVSTEGKISIPFKFLLDEDKIPKDSKAGFYLTKLDENYMGNHPLEYRQYSVQDPNEKMINYEDCIDYSKKCIEDCKYYFDAIKEAYDKAKTISSTQKTIL